MTNQPTPPAQPQAVLSSAELGIVDRLRANVDSWMPTQPHTREAHKLLTEAANEIDRLNSERLDLALLVGRLIRRMRAARIGDGLAEGDAVLEEEVLGYMRRKGLARPLRNEAPSVAIKRGQTA